MNIAVIGAGNIGRRHLQALAKLKGDYTIFTIDPSLEALQLALNMYNEVKADNSPDLFLLDNIIKLPKKLFSVIVATNSKQRYSVTKLLIDKEIKYIIFEKVLFQNFDEYREIEDALRVRQIKAWVNCWRRIVPFYQELKQKYQYQELLSFNVNGSNWGITSNAIHFIDLINYFTDYTDYQFVDRDIKIIKSKRSGYYEIVGELNGLFGEKQRPFSLYSKNGSSDYSCKIYLKFGNKTIIINDDEEWWIEENSEKSNMNIPYQSEMTQHYINDLFEKGNCNLTPFEISSDLHLPMIDYFTNIFKQNNIIGCPIT